MEPLDMLPDEASTERQQSRNLKDKGYIHVEVVYALPERQYIRALLLPNDSTVLQAIVASGLPQLRTDILIYNITKWGSTVGW